MPLRADRTVDDVSDFAVGDATSRTRAYRRYCNSIHAIPIKAENAKGGLLDYERQSYESVEAWRARLAMWDAIEEGDDLRRRQVKIAARDLLLDAWRHDDGPRWSQSEMVILAKHVLPDAGDPNRWSRRETCDRMRWSESTLRKHIRRARDKAMRWRAAQAV